MPAAATGPSSSTTGLGGGGGGAASSGILYALVARGSVVLAEHAAVSGNSSVVAVGLLSKVPQQEGFRASWAAGQHIFHVLCAGSGQLTYLCMAEQTLGKRLPFAFLSDIQQQFEQRYSAVAAGAVAYEMNTDFAPVLKERMHFFNTDPRADTLSRVRGEVVELKNVMVDNIEKVLGRGERLELLVEKTDSLGQQTFAFKRQARVLRHHIWWQNARMTAIIVGLVLLVAYLLVCVICSPTFKC